ncbi:MAG: stress protein, partial [Deltaproteobacteria bacterium]|nr:stress protein [Deltaproteobacteria bacterium]
FSGGPYTSDEGLNQGYTHGFIMTFIDVEARNHYLPHPEHQHVKTAILPAVGDVIAFDFQGP